MKPSNKAVLLAMAALATQAFSLVQMDVRFSDNMIDVGNTDIFAMTWQTIYATAGNQLAIVTDRSTGANTNPCVPIETPDPDITVRVEMDGAWGQTPGLKGHEMRDALVQSMWQVLKEVAGHNQYDVYTDCAGTVWMDGISPNPNAPCGPVSPQSCLEPCKDVNSPGNTQCNKHTLGHRVPSKLKAVAYINGQLQPDQLTITFSSSANPQSGGCGWVGAVASAVAGFIPVAGSLFAKGITLACDQ